MEIRLYFEGKRVLENKGSPSAQRDDIDLRVGFRTFLSRFDPALIQVKLIPCGGTPVSDFAKGIKTHIDDALCILLKDADTLLQNQRDPQYDGEDLPLLQMGTKDWKEKCVSATPDQFHFMVIEMESWFFADLEAVAQYYGGQFRLPGNIPEDVESIRKSRIVPNLEAATISCTEKYHKGKHPQEILMKIDPHKVAGRAPHAKRLFDTLTKKLKELS